VARFEEDSGELMATKVKINSNRTAQAAVHSAEALAKTQAAIAEPDNIVVDARGRRLVLVEPDFLTESRIMRAIGAASINQGYVMGYVLPAAMVVQIDDAKLPYPTTEQAIEAAIERLGHEGLGAVMVYLQAKAEAAQARMQAAQEGGAAPEAEALKNS
jgi:hypothetical protein